MNTTLHVDCACRNLREEFVSLPGLMLTLQQVARLLDVDRAAAMRVLTQLETEGLLQHSADGMYRRPTHQLF
ncbi:MAG TPA: helix-turn-helix domain-containing protein [Vicinamibacterales bacterium]